MHLLKILLIPICLLSLLLFSGCEVKLHCGRLDKENPALRISMFQQPDERMLFMHGSRTLALRKEEYAFSKPYTYVCETGGLMATFPPPCYCEEEFNALYYLNDSIPFSVNISALKPDNESISRITFEIAVAGTLYHTYLRPSEFQQFMEEEVKALVIIDSVSFKNVLDIPITNHPLISRIIIQQDVGLVGMVYDGELFVLKWSV